MKDARIAAILSLSPRVHTRAAHRVSPHEDAKAVQLRVSFRAQGGLPRLSSTLNMAGSPSEARDRSLSQSDPVLEILARHKIIAVVGLSRDPSKDSYRVAEYLKSNGYRIIPVNPHVDEILGEKCYASLRTMPENLQRTVEVVDIFRLSQDVPPIVKEAIELKAKYGRPYAVWMQSGIENAEAAQLAREAGMQVVMNTCMMIEHRARAEVIAFHLTS